MSSGVPRAVRCRRVPRRDLARPSIFRCFYFFFLFVRTLAVVAQNDRFSIFRRENRLGRDKSARGRPYGTTDDRADDYADDYADDVWTAWYDDAGDYVYRSRATGRPLTDAVERFRVRHRLIREAADALKYAFSAPVAASLCNLCVMALFDIYDHYQHSVYNTRNVAFVALWLAQYAFRFFAVVATAHATTNRVSRVGRSRRGAARAVE